MIDCGPGYQVKTIVIKPGQRLSLQKHEHRWESWTIASGNGRAEVHESVADLREGESVIVPPHTKHRMTNTSNVKDLVFVEVAYGEEISEADIIRLSDDYGRA